MSYDRKRHLELRGTVAGMTGLLKGIRDHFCDNGALRELIDQHIEDGERAMAFPYVEPQDMSDTPF
jgi:hypothetical protein